jgi:hypothetical protein
MYLENVDDSKDSTKAAANLEPIICLCRRL